MDRIFHTNSLMLLACYWTIFSLNLSRSFLFFFFTICNMASSVSLPLVVWHGLSNPDITCTTYSHSTIYAGQKDGHIWVYNLKNNSTLEHKLLLIGHKKAVVALCITQIETDTSLNADVLISAAEDGNL